MNILEYREDAVHEFRRLKGLADRAVAQIDDDAFFRTLDEETNSIAVVMKHMAGNMRSRWRDFLTTDGEKPDRHRDTEFVVDEDRAGVLKRWEQGWQILFDAITPLIPSDFERTVTIRREPHTVLEAIQRQLSHYAYHVGQIVLLARHFAGAGWQSLSIPKGKSEDFLNNPEAYLKK